MQSLTFEHSAFFLFTLAKTLTKKKLFIWSWRRLPNKFTSVEAYVRWIVKLGMFYVLLAFQEFIHGLLCDIIVLSLDPREIHMKWLLLRSSREQTLKSDLHSSCSSFDLNKHESEGLYTYFFSTGDCSAVYSYVRSLPVTWMMGWSAHSAGWQMALVWEEGLLRWRAGMLSRGTSNSRRNVAWGASWPWPNARAWGREVRVQRRGLAGWGLNISLQLPKGR